MRNFNTTSLLIIPLVLLLGLLASCSSDGVLDPTNGNHDNGENEGEYGADKGGFQIPDDLEYPEDEGGINSTYVHNINKDFATLEWDEVVFNIDLRGDYQVISLGPWSNGIELSVTVVTADPVILAGEEPEMFAITIRVPRWNYEQSDGPVTTGNCSLYEITNLPRNELVNVSMRLPMPGSDLLRKANIFWIREDDSFSDSVGFRPLTVDGENYFTYVSTMERDHRPDNITRMVLDPQNPGEDE